MKLINNNILGLTHNGLTITLLPEEYNELKKRNSAERQIYCRSNILIRLKQYRKNEKSEIEKILEKWLEDKELWKKIE